MARSNRSRLTAFARANRHAPTPSEAALWEELRSAAGVTLIAWTSHLPGTVSSTSSGIGQFWPGWRRLRFLRRAHVLPDPRPTGSAVLSIRGGLEAQVRSGEHLPSHEACFAGVRSHGSADLVYDRRPCMAFVSFS